LDAERTDVRAGYPVVRHAAAPRNQVRPTLVFLAAFGAGLILESLTPRAAFLPLWQALPAWLGPALAASGALLTLWCLMVFDRLGTGIMPDQPARVIVTTGPYAWSRNPMFVGFVLIHAGLAVWLSTFWALALLPAAVMLTTATVVVREEAYMRRAFGPDYERYVARVRRWIGRRSPGVADR
jgi:protein-S-isoprenylcysteine O-methyltransferase Ste14